MAVLHRFYCIAFDNVMFLVWNVKCWHVTANIGNPGQTAHTGECCFGGSAVLSDLWVQILRGNSVASCC